MSFNFCGRFGSQIFALIVTESHVSAFAGKDFTKRRANSAGSSGDERALTF